MRMTLRSRTWAAGRLWPVVLCGLLLAAMSGCGQAPAGDAPDGKLVSVKGQALFLDKPIPKATVTFHPLAVADKKAKTPFAVVQEDGTFLMTTYRPEDGAPAGEYSVTVSWFKPAKGTSADDGIGEELLPAKYQRPESSGLKVTVKADSSEAVVLKLTR